MIFLRHLKQLVAHFHRVLDTKTTINEQMFSSVDVIVKNKK